MRYDIVLKNANDLIPLTQSNRPERYLRLAKGPETAPELPESDLADPAEVATRRGRYGRSVEETVRALLPKPWEA